MRLIGSGAGMKKADYYRFISEGPRASSTLGSQPYSPWGVVLEFPIYNQCHDTIFHCLGDWALGSDVGVNRTDREWYLEVAPG